MMSKAFLLTAALAFAPLAAQAAACLGQESQVNIPMTGTTNILPEDQLCNPLPIMSAATPPAPNFTVGAVKAGAIAAPTLLTASSAAGFPTVTYDMTGIHLGVNGAVPGAQWTLTFTYLPANVSVQVPGYAGAQVTGVVLID